VTWGTWLATVASRWEFEDDQWTETDIKSEYRCWLLTEGQAKCKSDNVRHFLRAPLIASCKTSGEDELVQDKNTMMNVWKALPQWLTNVALDQNVHGAASLAERMRQGRVDIKARQRQFDQEKKSNRGKRTEALPHFQTDGELERATSSARS
jgi:hypothetical protein